MEIEPSLDANAGDFDEIAYEMARAMEASNSQPLNSDCLFATPSDAYLTFLELLKMTVPKEKLAALIQARGEKTLEDAVTPEFVCNLAMAELKEILKIPDVTK